MESWELAAREAIRDTIARYAHAADTGRFDDLAACFAEDGVLEIAGLGGGDGARAEGRAAIVAYLGGVGRDLAAATAVPSVRHHVSSTLIEVADPSPRRWSLRSRPGEMQGTARSYFLVVTEHGPDHWGRYRDRLAPGPDGRWLFTHRLARTDGATPGGWADSR